MGDFRDRLRSLRQEGGKKAERLSRERSEKTRRAREAKERVDRAADEVEAHIERCLRQFQAEFVEFRFDSYTREGRNFRVHWDEPLAGPDGKPDKVFHQLSLRVRRYYEFADVEVLAKSIIRNRERRSLRREEDVFEGDPRRLLSFVESEILEFTQLYTSPHESE